MAHSHTELSPDWLTAFGSGGPLDQSALPSGARSYGTGLPQTLWSVGVDGPIPDLRAAEAPGEGLGKEVRPFVIGPLGSASVTHWAWQIFKVTSFLKGAFVGSLEAPCWGQLSFPPQGKSSPPSGCQYFPWQPWLSRDHLSVESWTGLINGSFLVPSCLDHTWSRKSLCSFFPQC